MLDFACMMSESHDGKEVYQYQNIFCTKIIITCMSAWLYAVKTLLSCMEIYFLIANLYLAFRNMPPCIYSHVLVFYLVC